MSSCGKVEPVQQKPERGGCLTLFLAAIQRKPERGGCLTLFLAAMLVGGIGGALTFAAARIRGTPILKEPIPYVGRALFALFAVWVMGLLHWKKWAFWGYVGTCIGLVVFEFCAMKQPLLGSVRWLLWIGVLGLLLKPKWEYMRDPERKGALPAQDQSETGKSLFLRAWGRRYEFGALVCWLIYGVLAGLYPYGAASVLRLPRARMPAARIRVEGAGQEAGAFLVTISGTVSWNREGLPDARLAVLDDEQAEVASTTSDGDGHYSMTFEIRPGSYQVVSELPDDRYPDFWGRIGKYFTLHEGGRTSGTNVWDFHHSKVMRLLEPPNNSTVTSLTPTLRWQSFPGSDYYKVTWFDKGPVGGERAVEATGQGIRAEGTSYTFPEPLRRGRKYKWSVSAHNEGGELADSLSFCFSIAQDVQEDMQTQM